MARETKMMTEKTVEMTAIKMTGPGSTSNPAPASSRVLSQAQVFIGILWIHLKRRRRKVTDSV